MKRRIVPLLALAAAASAAHAQIQLANGVQLYGLVDTGVETIDHVGAANGRVTRMPSLSGGQMPSRWGLRGSEDLGGGLRAVFTLEAGFAPNSGAPLQGGRAFGRQSFVGLSVNWGTLTLGRQWSMSFFAMLDPEVIGPAVFGLAAFDPYLPAARSDNTLAYRGEFGRFGVGATYSLGRDGLPPANCPGENAAHDCRAWSVLLKYDTKDWGVAVAQDRQNGGPAGTFSGQPPGTFANATNTDTRTLATGFVRAGAAKFGGGVIHRKFKASPAGLSTNLYYVGVSTPVVDAFSVDAQLIAMRDARPNANAHGVVVRGNYAFSRRTAAYVLVGHVSNGANASYSVTAGDQVSVAPAAGRGQSGLMLGIRHSF
jgi:predicted porin